MVHNNVIDETHELLRELLFEDKSANLKTESTGSPCAGNSQGVAWISPQGRWYLMPQNVGHGTWVIDQIVYPSGLFHYNWREYVNDPTAVKAMELAFETPMKEDTINVVVKVPPRNKSNSVLAFLKSYGLEPNKSTPDDVDLYRIKNEIYDSYDLNIKQIAFVETKKSDPLIKKRAAILDEFNNVNSKLRGSISDSSYNKMFEDGWVRVANVWAITLGNTVSHASVDTWCEHLLKCLTPGEDIEQKIVYVDGEGPIRGRLPLVNVIEELCSYKMQEKFWTHLNVAKSMMHKSIRESRELLFELLEDKKKPTKADVFDAIKVLLPAAAGNIELRSGSGVRIGLIKKNPSFNLQGEIENALRSNKSPLAWDGEVIEPNTIPPRGTDILSSQFNALEVKFKVGNIDNIDNNTSMFIVVSKKEKGVSTAVETKQVATLRDLIKGGVTPSEGGVTPSGGVFLRKSFNTKFVESDFVYVNDIEQLAGTLKSDVRLFNSNSDSNGEEIFLSLKGAEAQQWGGFIKDAVIRENATVIKFVKLVISVSKTSVTGSTLTVTPPRGGVSMKLDNKNDEIIIKQAMFGSGDAGAKGIIFGKNRCNMIFKGTIDEIILEAAHPTLKDYKQLPETKTIYFNESDQIKKQQVCLHARPSDDNVEFQQLWKDAILELGFEGIERTKGVRFFLMPKEKSGGKQYTSATATTKINAAVAKLKASAMAGGATPGVQVPPGRSPNGKPASSESKTKKKILRNNAKVQGESLTDARLINRVKSINETRDLLEHLFEE